MRLVDVSTENYSSFWAMARSVPMDRVRCRMAAEGAFNTIEGTKSKRFEGFLPIRLRLKPTIAGKRTGNYGRTGLSRLERDRPYAVGGACRLFCSTRHLGQSLICPCR